MIFKRRKNCFNFELIDGCCCWWMKGRVDQMNEIMDRKVQEGLRTYTQRSYWQHKKKKQNSVLLSLISRCRFRHYYSFSHLITSIIHPQPRALCHANNYPFHGPLTMFIKLFISTSDFHVVLSVQRLYSRSGRVQRHGQDSDSNILVSSPQIRSRSSDASDI